MKSRRAFWKWLLSKDGWGTRPEGVDRNLENTARSGGFLIRRKEGKGESVSIQVGLDFGTSCTKVVYSQRGTRFFKSVCFDHDLPGYPSYCVPSLAAIDSRGRILLGPGAATVLARQEWDSGLRCFKVLVAGEVDPSFDDPITRKKFQEYCVKKKCRHLTPDRVAAVYLAWIMTQIRRRITSLPEFRRRKVDMAFNIGVPIDQVERARVSQEFERIFRWAELIYREWCTNTNWTNFNALEASYRWENRLETLRDEDRRVFTIPESVAQVASYLISLQKKEGLHAVIDLGAGTTDVSIFNLSLPSGTTSSYWYAARNIATGMDKIIRRLVEQDRKRSSIGAYSNARVARTVEFLARNPQKAGLVQRELKKIWALPDYHRTWGTAYHYKLKKQTCWEDVEVFLCGGGSGLFDTAASVFSRPWEWSNLKCRYPVRELPEPDDYIAGCQDVPFLRMAVAYGLAIPKPALEEYVLPSLTQDQTPSPLPELDLDRDDLYPKP